MNNRHLIYQYWTGNNRPGYTNVSVDMMKRYAAQFGADYRFDDNPRFHIADSNAIYHNAFRCVYDESFDQYDKILFCDMDIFIMDECNENIFENESVQFIGICEESHQPALRYAPHNMNKPIGGANDERWAGLMKRKYGTQYLINSNAFMSNIICRILATPI